MYIIFDKVHHVVQMGFTSEPLTIAQSGVQFVPLQRFALEDARVFCCTLPTAFDHIVMRPIHYRAVVNKSWLFQAFCGGLRRFVNLYRVIGPACERMAALVNRHLLALSALLVIGIVAHAFFLWGNKQKKVVAAPVMKRFDLPRTIQYLQETKLAKRMDAEKHAFVASDAFYYGASKGYLTIPVTAQRDVVYAGKPFVVFSRAPNAFVIDNQERVEPLKKSHCANDIKAYLFDGRGKVVVFANVSANKDLRRFVLTEASEEIQAPVNLCEDYAALIEHFSEL